MENLPSEEVPPEHLWGDPDGLEQWWAAVEQKRDDEASGDEPSEMVDNELARELKRG